MKEKGVVLVLLRALRVLRGRFLMASARDELIISHKESKWPVGGLCDSNSRRDHNISLRNGIAGPNDHRVSLKGKPIHSSIDTERST